jgi:hypothetical protein
MLHIASLEWNLISEILIQIELSAFIILVDICYTESGVCYTVSRM